MGQAAGVGADEVLETVITNALVVDYTGIFKADVGMKGGLISGLGKAGNPDVMEASASRYIYIYCTVLYCLSPFFPVPSNKVYRMPELCAFRSRTGSG